MMDQQLILDREHLAKYTLGDLALEREVLELFIGQIPDTLRLLRDSVEPEDWRRLAHTIKGSARAVGAWRLAKAAALAEARATDSDQWPKLAEQVRAEVDAVRRQISTGPPEREVLAATE